MPYYVIYNSYAGTWVHESLFRVKEFHSCEAAEDYIRKHRLNTRFYTVETVYIWR